MLAAIAIVTVPLPEPELPLLTTIQVDVLEADHAQPVTAVTPTVVVAPVAAAVCVDGLIA